MNTIPTNHEPSNLSAEDLVPETRRRCRDGADVPGRTPVHRRFHLILMPTAWRPIVTGLLVSMASTDSLLSRAADATPPAAPNAPQQISAPELDRAINEVISQRKYTWRMPRGTIVEDDANKGPIAKFFAEVGRTIRKWAHAVNDWIESIIEKIFKPKRTPASKGAFGWIASVKGLMFLLTAAIVCALAILFYRVWRRRQKFTTLAAAEPVASTPDVADETVDANQLPEDGWIQLGRELLGRGEFRLALRAFYLSSLAHLARRNLIAIARFKSNRDYERELRRRGHALPELLSVFGENVSVFDRIWYGMHEVNAPIVDQFAANVDKIKAV
jgi:uncharacterized protein DUF4129